MRRRRRYKRRERVGQAVRVSADARRRVIVEEKPAARQLDRTLLETPVSNGDCRMEGAVGRAENWAKRRKHLLGIFFFALGGTVTLAWVAFLAWLVAWAVCRLA